MVRVTGPEPRRISGSKESFWSRTKVGNPRRVHCGQGPQARAWVGYVSREPPGSPGSGVGRPPLLLALSTGPKQLRFKNKTGF